MTYLAVPIAVKNADEAIAQINLAQNCGAEMLELRTDYIENLSADLVVKLIGQIKQSTQKSLPIIVTCRDAQEGGAQNYPMSLRIDVFVAAIQAGADFVDCEYKNILVAENRQKIMTALLKSPTSRLIISAHNFETKFDDAKKLYHDILDLCPDAIPKLVYTANHISDCFEAFDLLHSTRGDMIVMCMGEAGIISRIIAKKLGSFVTFASLDDKSATAPGQLGIDELKTLYRWDIINSDTELYGIIADPVAHSLSPAVHNICFEDAKLNKLYLPLLVEGGQQGFDKFMQNILCRDSLDFKGFSITIPHKQNALNFVTKQQGFVEPLSQKIGAVNTLLIATGGKLSGYNTDYAGALDAITSTLSINRADLQDMPVAVIGAGGVARGIVAGLSDAGAKIRIYNRTIERGEKLAADFDCDFAPLAELAELDAKLLVNCTSIGMHPNIDAMPVPKEYLNKDMAVFDTVYNPAQTLLLKHAKKAGAKTIDGVTMFVNQAMAQFKLFAGQKGEPKLMEKTIYDCLSSR